MPCKVKVEHIARAHERESVCVCLCVCTDQCYLFGSKWAMIMTWKFTSLLNIQKCC